LQREDGDQVDGVHILRFGDVVGNATALLRPSRYDVLWQTSYTLPDGAYDVVVTGHDIHNNSFASPPLTVHVAGVDLKARVPNPPDAAVKRAEQLSLHAVVLYPDQTPVKAGTFTAHFVLDASGAEMGSAPFVMQRAGWLLNWTPPVGATLGHYRVVIDGDDGLGDKAAPQEAFGFELAEGVLQRSFAFQRGVANRTELISWLLPADGNDTEMHFTLRDDQGGQRDLEADLSNGAYLVKWRPLKDEQLGRYTLVAGGMDAAHNAILATSRGLTLLPAQIGVVTLSTPGNTLKPGDAGRWVFQLQYVDGTVLPANQANQPQIAMLSGDKVADPAPKLSVEDGHWVVTWTPIKGKHTGVFRLAVGGRDQSLNEVQLNFLPTFRIDEGPLKDILGVPGFEAALLPVALVGAALLVRRKRED
ncbi:MAG: hypothetical protein LC624_05360, partial [Halobacteriales archaeon]|nr:hypothetical protein [Halobacteriales archaeon]